jgi:hypothetical protein
LTTTNTLKVIGEDSLSITISTVIYCGYGPTMPEVPLNRPPGRSWVKWFPVVMDDGEAARRMASAVGFPDAALLFEKEIAVHKLDLGAKRESDGFHWFWICVGSEYPKKEDLPA